MALGLGRRQVLGGLATLGLAGCLDRAALELELEPEPDPPTLSVGIDVETKYYLHEEVLRDGIHRVWDTYRYRSLHTFIATAADAAARVNDGRDAGFITNTTFDDTYVVVVQAVGPSEPDLVVRDITRIDTGLDVTVTFWTPADYVTPDVAMHTLAIRVHDRYVGVPPIVKASVDHTPTQYQLNTPPD